MKNLVKIYLVFILLIFFSFGNKISGQGCVVSESYATLSGNNIKTIIPINGNLFWTEKSRTLFTSQNSNSLPPQPNTFKNTGIWVGAKNSAGELKLAAAIYQTSYNYDFFPGPIHNANNQISFNCEDFDRTWEVFGHEILQHISDFANNGIIDQPISNIYAYPAHQNPHFEAIHGFELPNTPQGLAPFSDQNNDGIYNPDDGDFPLPEGVATNKIPKHMTWGVFNDGAGSHTLTGGEPLNIEVQLTAYAFYCNESELLNNTIFTSHKIINRGNETLDSLIFTKYLNFDIGCYADDYFGCIPDLNTVYAYNKDEVDGEMFYCMDPFDPPPFGTNIPVQAATILNREMTSFNYFFASVQNSITYPISPEIDYNFMQGKWGNGSSLTQGGDGYDTGGQPVKFAFPDNPNNPNGWSMFSEELLYDERKCLANIEIDGSFAPNDIVKIDMAYTTYQDPFLNHVETVDLVYNQTPLLQQMYDNQFEDCDLSFCPNDCVWTGDANRDSIVSTSDILQIGLAHGQTGVERDKPLIWQPFYNDDWGGNLNGVDLKHADCNGDGTINNNDFDWVNLYSGNSYKLGTPIDEYPQGPEISILSDPDYPLDQIGFISLGKGIIELNQADDIYGLAFTLEFDPTYLFPIFATEFSPWDNQANNLFTYSRKNEDIGTIDFAFVKTDGMNSSTSIGQIGKFTLSRLIQDFELVQTYLRIKNIKVILNNGALLNYGAQDFLVNINNPNGNGQILPNKNLDEANIQIFPNPTSDILNIKMENSLLANFSIFDIYGKKVLEKTNVNQSEIQLSTSNFSQGIYFLKIEMEEKELVKKFIKM